MFSMIVPIIIEMQIASEPNDLGSSTNEKNTVVVARRTKLSGIVTLGLKESQALPATGNTKALIKVAMTTMFEYIVLPCSFESNNF